MCQLEIPSWDNAQQLGVVTGASHADDKERPEQPKRCREPHPRGSTPGAPDTSPPVRQLHVPIQVTVGLEHIAFLTVPAKASRPAEFIRVPGWAIRQSAASSRALNVLDARHEQPQVNEQENQFNH